MSFVAIVFGPAEFRVGNALRRELEAGGLPCWFGPRDLLAGAPTLDGQRDAVREARVVAVVVPPGDGPHPPFIEEALLAARFGAAIVPVPADADPAIIDGAFADALARIRAFAIGPLPPTERVPTMPARRESRLRGVLAVILPVLAAALVSAGILSAWAAAPRAFAQLAKRVDLKRFDTPVANLAQLRGPEVVVTGSRSNQGWSLMFHVHKNVREIEYRLDSMSAFESLGQAESFLDQETLTPLPKTWVDVGKLRRPVVIEVKLHDKDGGVHGPIRLRFDPIAEEIRQSKSRLAERGESWVHAQDSGGKTHLYFVVLSQKPAIRSIHYGFDGAAPATNLFFVPNLSGEYNMKDDYSFPAPRGARTITMDIEFKDGTHLKRSFSVVPDPDPHGERG